MFAKDNICVVEIKLSNVYNYQYKNMKVGEINK